VYGTIFGGGGGGWGGGVCVCFFVCLCLFLVSEERELLFLCVSDCLLKSILL
jgi:hypothetical protein